MITNRDFLYVREIRKDAMARAERERLIRQVEKQRTPLREHYQLVLAKLGTWLVAHGQRLKARYAST